jgi:hypothetical protein
MRPGVWTGGDYDVAGAPGSGVGDNPESRRTRRLLGGDLHDRRVL